MHAQLLLTQCVSPCRVDNGIPLAAALQQHHAWLCEQGFVGPSQRAVAVTWTDWDLKVHNGQPASLHRTHCRAKGHAAWLTGSVRDAGPRRLRLLRHQMRPESPSPQRYILDHCTLSYHTDCTGHKLCRPLKLHFTGIAVHCLDVALFATDKWASQHQAVHSLLLPCRKCWSRKVAGAESQWPPTSAAGWTSSTSTPACSTGEVQAGPAA